jgi:hydroxypyruvate reductase 1
MRVPSSDWRISNPRGKNRVIVTKELPGERWLQILEAADCRVEICQRSDVVSTDDILKAFGDRCAAAIGQLTESWDETLFSALKAAGGAAYSNYAVGFNNVDIPAATRNGIAVGNTPGVLTETTAEMAVALTFAAARRIGESERYLRAGKFNGWLPTLFLGELLRRKTLGIVGAGRIGTAYARMMVEGHRMNVLYYDLHRSERLESSVAAFNDYLHAQGESPVNCRQVDSVDELLKASDCVSIHTVLDDSTRHLINAERLALMKPEAILINTSRGPVIEEAALVDHSRANPDFRTGLDVFENEPELAEGLTELENVVIVPHIASATQWTRQGMAILAASNVAGLLNDYPVWNRPDILPFITGDPPDAVPSILNAEALGLSLFGDHASSMSEGVP